MVVLSIISSGITTLCWPAGSPHSSDVGKVSKEGFSEPVPPSRWCSCSFIWLMLSWLTWLKTGNHWSLTAYSVLNKQTSPTLTLVSSLPQSHWRHRRWAYLSRVGQSWSRKWVCKLTDGDRHLESELYCSPSFPHICPSFVSLFTDLRSELGECSVVIADRFDGQND